MMMFLPNETREETESFVEYAVSEWNKDTTNDREYVIIYEEKVMIKIGMTFVDNSGTRFYPKTGVTSGEYLYEITKEEYYQQKGIGDSSKISRCGDAKIGIRGDINFK